jgi:hypothetical protein
MNWKSQSIILMALILMIGISQAQEKASDFPALKGPYLGQDPPGMTALIFAPGIVSTGHIEKCATFTPDGKEFYFAVLGEATSFIAFMKIEDNRWTGPQIAPFSGRYEDDEFGLSPDGKKLYLASYRPLTIKGQSDDNSNLWVVSRTNTGWSEPHSLGSFINTDDSEYYPSVANDGTLYFYRREKDDNGDWDIYSSRFVEGNYTKPERLGDTINSSNWDFDPFIAPDESYLIFSSLDRVGGHGASDLYISFRKQDGSWTKAINLGNEINSSRWEFSPRVTVDGKFLFFASNRRFREPFPETVITYEEKMKMLNKELNSPGNGHSDIYWVDAKIIEELRPEESKIR